MKVKEENRDNMRAVAFGLLVMLAVPGAYRIWVHYHPAPPRPSIVRILAEAENRREEELLLTSCDRWSEADRSAHPAVYAWLSAWGARLLPWDWSASARQKDPDGYRRCWLSVLQERIADLKSACTAAEEGVRAQDRTASDRQALLDHWTNQVSAVSTALATNVWPAEVRFVSKEKGRFWGWNEKTEVCELRTDEEARALLADLEARAEGFSAAVREARSGAAALRESAERLGALIGELTAARAQIEAESAEPLDVRIARLKIVRTIVKSLGVR